MKNKLSDLNNHLFMVLERLNDEDLQGEKLSQEIERATSVTRVAKAITDNAHVMLDAKKHFDEYGIKSENEIPEILRISDGKA